MAVIWDHAPAKVNLALHVVGQRQDGYHLLDSLVAFCSVGDRIGVAPSSDFQLEIVGPFGGALSAEPDNLVLRAARGLKEQLGNEATELGAHITLEKNLPVSSGIGGGSADAAATLRALQKLWKLQAPKSALESLALSLGADVPVCLHSRSTFMEGIGEELTPTPPLPEIPAVLVNPGVAVSTPAVFGKLLSKTNPPIAQRVWADETGFFDALASMRNDLEAPAIAAEPAIGEVKAALMESQGCRLARMSGSGATVFGLFSSDQEAKAAAMTITGRYGWWSAPTTLGVDRSSDVVC